MMNREQFTLEGKENRSGLVDVQLLRVRRPDVAGAALFSEERHEWVKKRFAGR